MKPTPANKTAIVGFVIDELLMKLWNVSTDMRKRLRWILKNMNVTVRDIDEKTLSLNGWLTKGEFGIPVKELAEIKKGVSNYSVETQDQLDKIISVNKSIRCFELCFKPEIPLEFEWLGNLELNLDSYEYYSKCSFKRINRLGIYGLSKEQLTQILSKTQEVDHLVLSGMTLSKLALKRSNTKVLRLNSLKFTENIELPVKVKHLDVKHCTNLKFLKCKEIDELEFSLKEEEMEDQLNWLKNQKGVKEIGIERPLSTSYKYFPCSIRTINWPTESDCDKVDLAEMKQKLPYLVSIEDQISIEVCNKLNLRKIHPIMTQNRLELALKPRKISINEDNCAKLKECPQLFEKVEIVVVDSDCFNFDCLGEKIKQIHIHEEVDLESKTLSRLEKE